MKWSIVGLLLLGTIAALSAVVFVVSYQSTRVQRAAAADSPSSDTPKTTVLVAANDLEPMTVIRADMVVPRSVAVDVAPAGSFTDPIQVVGKFLVTPLSSGQPFTQDRFAQPGSGLNLASGLTPGMRAVSVAVVESMAIGSLIYPGSVVDVIGAFKQRDRDDPVSFTLLRGVMVLAIGQRTITEPDKPTGTSTVENRKVTVTLLVDPDQAEQLKLVSEEGSISLAMRNPMDTAAGQSSGTRLSKLVTDLTGFRVPPRAPLQTMPYAMSNPAANTPSPLTTAIAAMLGGGKERETARRTERETKSAKPDAPDSEEERCWEVLILRGGVAATKTFAQSDFAVRGQ
jgi:pilus assembly protein CpaB